MYNRLWNAQLLGIFKATDSIRARKYTGLIHCKVWPQCSSQTIGKRQPCSPPGLEDGDRVCGGPFNVSIPWKEPLVKHCFLLHHPRGLVGSLSSLGIQDGQDTGASHPSPVWRDLSCIPICSKDRGRGKCHPRFGDYAEVPTSKKEKEEGFIESE